MDVAQLSVRKRISHTTTSKCSWSYQTSFTHGASWRTSGIQFTDWGCRDNMGTVRRGWGYPETEGLAGAIYANGKIHSSASPDDHENEVMGTFEISTEDQKDPGRGRVARLACSTVHPNRYEVFSRFLAPYVENLDMGLLNLGIVQGQVTLGKLRIKKGALDSFRLPIDVSEECTEDSAENQGFIASFLAKLLNNIQVTVKNVHIRYEDNISVPGHPFAVGVTLASFSAISVDGNWVPAFIEGSSKTVHKLAKLEYLAGYFDTDTQNMSGQSYEAAVERFSSMIAREGAPQDHQFVLKPVSGEGRVVLRHKAMRDAPRFDIELMFPEIGVLLDDHQFRDIISLLETVPLLRRKSRFARYRRPEEFKENRPRALLTFAGSAILDSVRERRRRWTWAFFAERRDDRRRYVELFKKKQLNSCSIELLVFNFLSQELSELEELEKKLSYEDIRFYRSISRSELRKDGTLRKQVEDEKMRVAAQSSGWTSWLPIWGSSSSAPQTHPTQESPFENMTDQQRRELYEVLDYDEKAALTESFELPKDALKMRVQAQLKRGTFALKTDPHGMAQEIISVIFDKFQATAIQRRDNLEVSSSLGGFSVFDGTTRDTLFPQIVHVKQDSPTLGSATEPDPEDPFLYMKFENNPLDERADTALAIRMRHMEVVYHRGYVEAIYKFFKPPEDRLESVEALLVGVNSLMPVLGYSPPSQTAAGGAIADMKAPIIIVPESISTHKCTHLLIDAGHISIESDLASKEAIRQVHLKRAQQYTDDDYARLESLMYDKLDLKLEDAQFVLGGDLQSCRSALTSLNDSSLHIIERVSIDLQVQNSIVPSVASLARFKISGKLPTLQLNFSDSKYKSILRLIDVTIPRFDDSVVDSNAVVPSDYHVSSGLFYLPETEYNVDESDYEDAEEEQSADDKSREGQRMFELSFQVTTLRACLYKSQSLASEKLLGHVSFDTFSLLLSLTQHDMKIGVRLGSLSMEVAEPGFEPLRLLSSADGSVDVKDLLRVDYTRVQNASPEYEGFDQDITVDVSTVIFWTAPEPLLTLYDLIMTTFVPSSPIPGEPPLQLKAPRLLSSRHQNRRRHHCQCWFPDRHVILIDCGRIRVTEDTMNVHVRLGSLSLSDDSGTETSSPDFKKLMFIEAASVTFHYLEQPLHDIYVFLLKLAKLKGLYDTATEVAVQRASEIERMGSISPLRLRSSSFLESLFFPDYPVRWLIDNAHRPDTEVNIKVSEIKLALTEFNMGFLTVKTVKLQLFDRQATTEVSLKEHGIARFALSDNSVRVKTLSDGAMETQVVLRSFTMSNTTPAPSKFREIIPAAQHDRNQFMLLYTSSGGSERSSLAVLTVDSPHILFSLAPVFALMEFFTSAFGAAGPDVGETEVPKALEKGSPNPAPTEQAAVQFRLDLHDVSISVLEDDLDSDSQAIRLTPDIIVATDDNIDLTFKPIVLRASYRDIMLILTIVNKAIDAYGKQTSVVSSSKSTRPSLAISTTGASKFSGGPTQDVVSDRGEPSNQLLGTAHVVLSKEQLKASFDGFRLILIGDLHEQPLLHLVASWKLRAATTLETSINYWNLTNSHWEPLIDPWTFTASVSRELSSYALATKVTSTERLNVNLSTAFIELALETLNSLSRESEHVLQKARGSRAPYRIRNLTGTTLRLWSGAENTIGASMTGGRCASTHRLVIAAYHPVRRPSVGKLSGVPVDREGEYTFALRPRTEQCYNRLLCEVRVEASIKIVTLRSTYRVQNRTLYPLEIAIGEGGDQSGGGGVIVKLGTTSSYYFSGSGLFSPSCEGWEKQAQGATRSLVAPSIWKKLVLRLSRRGLWVPVVPSKNLGRSSRLPVKKSLLSSSLRTPRSLGSYIPIPRFCEDRRYWSTLKLAAVPEDGSYLMAPIQLENLLPYNIQYRIYDKDTDQNWRSYLRAGGIMPIHSVELTHLVLLNVEILDTAFKASEFSIINTDGHSDFDIESRLTLQDAQGRKLDLRLNYVTSPPQDVAGETQTVLCHTSSSGDEFIFSVGKSSWSKAVSLEAPTADMALAIPSQSQKNEETHVGLSWSEGLGKYKLTKVITLAPRFLVKNNLSEAMCFREHSVVPHGRSVLDPGDRVPLYTLRTRDKLLTVAFPGMNNQWSPPISIEDIGSVHFRLRRPGERGTTHLIRADIKMDGATIFISLNLADDDWPFLIENDSSYTVNLCQIDATHANVESAKMYPTYRLPERTSIPYAWDFPAAREKKLLLAINGSRRPVDILEIGDLVPFKFQDGRGIGVISMDARASGHQQVLRLSHYNEETSPYRPKSRTSGASLRVDSMSSGTEAFEAVTDDIQPSFMLDVNLDGIGLSLVNRRVIEVVYLSLERLKIDYTASPVAQSVTLSCDTVQIDNQLYDATFPVVLQPTPISGQASDIAALPTVQFSLTWLNDQGDEFRLIGSLFGPLTGPLEHGVQFIKYCSILLQALTIQADEDFLYAVYELSKIRGASWEEEQIHILIEQPVDIPEPEDLASENNLYFEVLELQPIRLSLSFERTDRVSGEEKLELRNPLAVIVNAVTMAIGNVKDAPLEMNALAIKDMRLTPADLQTRIMYHYRQDVLRQLYRILGSADFIGNPVGLFTNVSSGVADIFYEPFTGAVMRGNRDLGVGIAKGAASFVKKTVFGFSDSVTKVTSSIGKGLSAATLDSEYQKRRRMNQRRNKPRHAIYGVTAGAEAFASSIASGVEGVVMKPIEGAESEGALGFFKGVGKGLVGAVTKPAVGFFDLASNLSEGVRNTTTVFDRPARDRIRWPRHVPPDRVLVPFSEREALGQYWLKDVDNGAYRQEFYVAHINLPGGDGEAASELGSPLDAVKRVVNEDHGIRFVHKTGKDLDKLILLDDKKSQAWFYEQIAGVVKAFNAKRRMDS
ncbi:hypothetical protein EI94DRAFT_1696360 [Lactarius quietus]|nr:hypothetical protein EI94DRAFT_1696360 [Lactarius quietus]